MRLDCRRDWTRPAAKINTGTAPYCEQSFHQAGGSVRIENNPASTLPTVQKLHREGPKVAEIGDSSASVRAFQSPQAAGGRVLLESRRMPQYDNQSAFIEKFFQFVVVHIDMGEQR